MLTTGLGSDTKVLSTLYPRPGWGGGSKDPELLIAARQGYFLTPPFRLFGHRQRAEVPPAQGEDAGNASESTHTAQIRANTPGEGQAVTQVLASVDREGRAALMALPNLSSCLGPSWDCAGPGQLWAQEGPDSRTAVLAKEGAQSCDPCCYPLSPVWDSLGPRSLLHPSPTSLSWCSALHAVGAQ